MNEKNKILVWDPLVRIFHWLLAICFITAYLVEDERLHLHLLTGSIVFGLIIFRLVWGVIGLDYSRFTDFACSISDIRKHLHALIRLRATDHLGHTPMGVVMIMVLLIGLLLLTLSGAVLYGVENSSLAFSPLVAGLAPDVVITIENLHGLVADGLVLMVLLHIGGVVVESLIQKQNLIWAMFTGYKKVKQEKR